MTDILLSLGRSGATPQTLERDLGVLRGELLAVRTLAIRRPATNPPDGAKSGTASSIGELVLTGVLSTGTIAAVTRVIGDFLKRNADRSVTVRRGDTEITLTGQSQKEQLELLRATLSEVSDADRLPAE